MKNRVVRVLAVMIFLLIFAGCSWQSSVDSIPSLGEKVAWGDWRSDQPPTPRPKLTEEEKLTIWEQDWDSNQAWLMERFGVEAPKPEIIRWTGYEEFLQMMVECMQDAGWDVKPVDGGFLDPDVGVEQGPAIRVSEVVCRFQYPRDPRYGVEFDAAQRGVLYDYKIQWWIPCMQSKGFSTFGNPPSRESYIAGVTEPIPGSSEIVASWDPFLHWSHSFRKDVSYPEVQEILVDCPRNPPSEALWPS